MAERPRFWKKMGQRMATGTLVFGVAFSGSACEAPVVPTQSPIIESLPTSSHLETPELVAISTQEVLDISRKAVDSTNRYLNLGLNPEKILSRIRIFDSASEYLDARRILGETTNIDPDAKPAVTITMRNPEESEIFLYRKGLQIATSLLPEVVDTEAGLGEFVELVVGHEILHLIAPRYNSPTLESTIISHIQPFEPQLSGKKITQTEVSGAKIHFYANDTGYFIYSRLDEAEAILISNAVLNSTGEMRINQEIGARHYDIPSQGELLTDLLTRLPGGYTENLKKLAEFRNVIGGRERWFEHIGKSLNMPQADRIGRVMNLIATIDSGRGDLYYQTVNLYQP